MEVKDRIRADLAILLRSDKIQLIKCKSFFIFIQLAKVHFSLLVKVHTVIINEKSKTTAYFM